MELVLVDKQIFNMDSVFAERFKSARKMAGLSLQLVADRMGGIITKQALHKYEQGKSVPDSEVLALLAQALSVRPDYFSQPSSSVLEQVEFRKRAKLTKTEEASILAYATYFFERYTELETLLGENQPFVNPIIGEKVSSAEQVEELAAKFRKVSKLGNDPIPNVIEMFESKGIKVLLMGASSAFDGLSALNTPEIGSTSPVIVINEAFDNVRIRFTAVHELAHHVLDFVPGLSHRDKENFCHRFAAAFLVPREPFLIALSEHRTKLSFRELIDLKEYYGVSIQALIRRAKDLEIITESVYTGLSIYISQQGWRKNEPGRYIGEEKATRFDRLLGRAVVENALSIGKAAALKNQSLAEFRKYFMIV